MRLWFTYYLENYPDSDNVELFEDLPPEQEETYRAAIAAGEAPEQALASFLEEIREGIIKQEKENFAEWGDEWDDSYTPVLYDLEWKE